MNSLTPALERLAAAAGKPYTWYLTELLRQEVELLELKEQLIDPVRKFMGGPQKEIYIQAKAFIKDQEANFTYIKGDEVSQVRSVLDDPACFKGNRMQQVKTLIDILKAEVAAQIEKERSDATSAMATLKERLQSMNEFSALAPDKQEQITTPFEQFAEAVGKKALIAVIRDALRRFEEDEYPNLLSRMAAWSQPQAKPPGAEGSQGADGDSATSVEGGSVEEQIQYVSSRSIRVDFDKAWLADEADVDRYLELMREALLDAIRKGKRIQT